MNLISPDWVPGEIRDAARKVDLWMQSQGHTKWALMGIQSREERTNRKLAIKLIRNMVEASLAHYQSMHEDNASAARVQLRADMEREACEIVLNAIAGEQEWTEQEIQETLGL